MVYFMCKKFGVGWFEIRICILFILVGKEKMVKVRLIVSNILVIFVSIWYVCLLFLWYFLGWWYVVIGCFDIFFRINLM